MITILKKNLNIRKKRQGLLLRRSWGKHSNCKCLDSSDNKRLLSKLDNKSGRELDSKIWIGFSITAVSILSSTVSKFPQS